jgi:hypothetical protein
MSAYATAARVLPRDGEAAKPAFPIDGECLTTYSAPRVDVTVPLLVQAQEHLAPSPVADVTAHDGLPHANCCAPCIFCI